MSQTINLTAGQYQEFFGVCNFIRILEASAPLKLEFFFQGREVAEALDVGDGYAEKFELGTFDRVRLLSSTTQTVQFITRLGNVVQYDKAPIGDTNIVGGVMLTDAQLRAAVVDVRDRPEAPTNWAINRNGLAVNTALQLVAPAANVNGLILLSAQIGANGGGAFDVSLIAKASAPLNVADGEIILMAAPVQRGGTDWVGAGQLAERQYIAAGKGLYAIASTTMPSTDGNFQTLRYRLL